MLNSISPSLIRLSQALNEKICHDFAGTIGVIDNSIDLIKTIEYQEKAIKLIQDSTNRLIRYLQFYRYLYSLASEDSKTSIVEVNRLATDFLKSKNHNIELIFTRLYSIDINDHIAQIIICLIVVASNNLSKNAIIKVELEIQHDKFIGMKIVVIATNLKFDQNKTDILLGTGANSSDHSSITIENVHEYYTYYLITEYGYKLLVTPLIDSVEYTLML
ncbi:MAG TPA: hypothetical protein LFW13_02370 [Rickettsia endosymbiont of Sericostoma sp.]|uniref:histidine phosphotransferase family protein n=1 Tax=unclassified Candidatus Tisiphia TaxID=2996318 RepID=UPI001DED58C6|nr:hypothetical protein [Rickettsia endosymbiont of Sericostoma sp.]